jgi:hypothetical protein
LLYKQQVKNCYIIKANNVTNFHLLTVCTLFALQTEGENQSHYLLYIQQVKEGHIICFGSPKIETGFYTPSDEQNWF